MRVVDEEGLGHSVDDYCIVEKPVDLNVAPISGVESHHMGCGGLILQTAREQYWLHVLYDIAMRASFVNIGQFELEATGDRNDGV